MRIRAVIVSGVKTKSSSGLFDLAKKPDELAEYIEWLSVPAAERVPPSQAKMAKHLGVSEFTLRQWKRDNRVVGKVLKKHVGNVGVDLYPDVIEALRVQALDPSNPRSVTAARALLAELNTQTEVDPLVVDVDGLSDTELRDLALEMFDRIDGIVDPVTAVATVEG